LASRSRASLGLGHVAGDERDLLEFSRYALHRPLACRGGQTPVSRRLAQLRENDKPVLIYSTFPSAAEAERIGGALVDQRLAACVNIFPA
jgi:hypothetical protein